ncbi:hypothetical protein OAI26_05230, partial [Sulfitobacter sp.]|nr:hypothetical protein [Sulfitobacter sp.]
RGQEMWIFRRWWLWAGYCIISIFAFATIYYALADDFYHSTAKYEPTVWSDNIEIGREIASSFETKYSEIGLDKIFVSAEPSQFFYPAPRADIANKYKSERTCSSGIALP